jgi:hypothetical protein
MHLRRFRLYGSPEFTLNKSPEHHTQKGSKVYTAWSNMIQRCTNPKSTYYYLYGGRGIKVCNRWRNSFISFSSDMGERPEGHQIDRIDSNGDYEPSNCRWVTPTQQARNRRMLSAANTSGFRGVSQHKRSRKWCASVWNGDKQLWLGEYDSPIEAAKRYNKEASMIFKNEAQLNVV